MILLLTTLVGFAGSTYLKNEQLAAKTQTLIETQQKDVQLLTVMVQDVRVVETAHASKLDEHDKTLTAHGERIGKAEVRLDLLREGK